MNQHRKMSDRLIRLGNITDESRLNIRGLSRARYNRYFEIKSKLRLIKEQFLTMRNVQHKKNTRVKYIPPEGLQPKPKPSTRRSTSIQQT